VENIDVDFVLRVTIALLVITSPFDPVKLLFFNQVVEGGTQKRATAAVKLALSVAVRVFGRVGVVGSRRVGVGRFWFGRVVGPSSGALLGWSRWSIGRL
jgi:multiple antibiotic resistance protein